MLGCEDLINTSAKCCTACHDHEPESLEGWAKIKYNGKEYAVCCTVRKLERFQISKIRSKRLDYTFSVVESDNLILGQHEIVRKLDNEEGKA